VRISAWNIQNGGGNRIEGIARALSDAGSDVCVLSEYTNASSLRLITALKGQGYEHVLHSYPENRWGGVLIASRVQMERGDIVDCPSPERWLHVVVGRDELEIGAAYIPNAERSRTEKSEYWRWLLGIGDDLVRRDAIICGDFNTGLPLVDEVGKTLRCAEEMRQMLDSQWTDLWRVRHLQERESSWWSNVGNGFRLDHAFATTSVAPRCKSAEYLTVIDDQCIAHPARAHEGCERKALSDHSMLVVDLD
jgi:exodeoxyribonuclease III